jgi:hypothetical protein
LHVTENVRQSGEKLARVFGALLATGLQQRLDGLSEVVEGAGRRLTWWSALKSGGGSAVGIALTITVSVRALLPRAVAAAPIVCHCRAIARGEDSAVEASSETYLWPPEVAADLMQATLIFAWHSAKWDRRVPRLALGMLPSVAESIAALTPQALAAVASRASGALRLRWQDYPEFWVHLLMAARADDQEVLEEIHLHAQLLLSGELIADSTLARVPA